MPSKVWEWLQNTLNKINEFFKSAVQTAKTKSTEFLNNVVNVLKNLPSNVWSAIVGAVTKVTEWGGQMANKAKDGAKKVFDNVINGIKSLPAQVANIGKNIVQGIWNGISGAAGWIVGKVKEFARGILDGMKSALGIHSPSKLFEEQIGKNLALGVGAGFSQEMKTIQKEMQEAIPTSFETDIKANINAIKTPFTGYQSEGKTAGFRPRTGVLFAQECGCNGIRGEKL